MVSWQAAILALAVSGGSGETVLLDFGADWCGPCRQMEPIVRQLTSEGYPVRQVNIDRERELADQYQVSHVPCFVMLVEGREVDRVVGGASRQRLEQMLKLASAPPSAARGQSPDSKSSAGLSIPSMRSEPPLVTVAKSRASVPTSSPATPAANSDIAQQLLAASVRIRINDGDGHSVGSGTIIDARSGEALILTCGHVFRDSQGKGQITVDLFGPGAPKNLPARMVDFDLKSDLGLISIRPGVPVQTAPLAAASFQPQKHDAVITIGCSHGADPTAIASRVTAIDKYLGSPNLQVAGQPVQGRSGGGLFTAEGRVIGVCNAADPADNEGLFASLPSIHAKLGRIGLADLLFPKAQPPATPVAAIPPAEPTAPRMPSSMPPPAFASAFATATTQSQTGVGAQASAAGQLTGQEQSVLGDMAGAAQGAEVICIVRSLANPRAKSEIIVLDKASPAFLERLAADRQQQASKHLTSLQIPNSAQRLARSSTSSATWQPKWKKRSGDGS